MATSPVSSSSSEPGSPFRTFEEDVGGGRAIASLRLLGAVVVLAGGAWLVVSTPTPFAGGMALLALLVALAWIGGYVRSRRRTATLVLSLTPEALEVTLGDRVDRAAWADVAAVVVDEDRLVVKIERRSGEPLVLDPLWRGLGVYDLEAAIRAAWVASGAVPPGGPARSRGAVP